MMPTLTKCMTCKDPLLVKLTPAEDSRKVRCDTCQREYEYARDNDL